jgi:hypothetical protein
MNNISQAEMEFMYFQAGTAGSFTESLIRTIMKADRHNTEKLRLGFPELTSVVYRYQNEAGYWEDLSSRWKNAHSNVVSKQR